MYKLLLVTDKQPVLEAFEGIHSWEEMGFRKPNRIPSIDLLVTWTDGSLTGFSVKVSRKEIDLRRPMGENERKRVEQNVRRQIVEMKYCERVGIRYRLLFKEEMDIIKANNIRAAMAFYDPSKVKTPEQMYRFLIARKIVVPNLSEDYIPFAKIASENEEEIRELFRKSTEEMMR